VVGGDGGRGATLVANRASDEEEGEEEEEEGMEYCLCSDIFWKKQRQRCCGGVECRQGYKLIARHHVQARVRE